MPNLTVSANVDTLMQAADYAAFRTSLGLGALSTVTPGTGVATALAVNVGSAGAFITFGGDAGTPSALVGTNITGTAAGLTAGTASAVAVGGITGLGTGVATALAVNVGSAGAFVTFNGALGMPSSGTVTNLTGTASININGTVGATTPTTGVFTTVQSANIGVGTAAISTAGIRTNVSITSTGAGAQIIYADGTLTAHTDSILMSGISTTASFNTGGFSGLFLERLRITGGISGGGSVTQLCGIRIANQTGATTNYAILADGGLFRLEDTTEATTGAAGSIVTLGGIYSTKKIISATDITALGVVELGNASDTTLSRSAAGVLAVEGVVIPSVSSTNTLTNKRITKRVVTVSDATSITPNADTSDIVYQANTQGAGTLTINAPTGTPTDSQGLVLKLSCTAVQTFSWNAAFVGGAVALPTSSPIGVSYFSFLYDDAVQDKWHFVGQAIDF